MLEILFLFLCFLLPSISETRFAPAAEATHFTGLYFSAPISVRQMQFQFWFESILGSVLGPKPTPKFVNKNHNFLVHF